MFRRMESFVEWIASYQQYLRPGALLTDATGVKGAIVERIQSMLRPDVEFIAAHPMGITVREICELMPGAVTSTKVGCICQHLSEIGVIENKGKILNGTGGRICVWRAR